MDLSLCAGVRDAFNPHAVLELISVSVGEVRIRSVETGLYLSMGSDGKVGSDPFESGLNDLSSYSLR